MIASDVIRSSMLLLADISMCAVILHVCTQMGEKELL